MNEYGLSELLIDGGIICNNPALYAYEMAHQMYNHTKIRVLSLGTGEKPFSGDLASPDSFSHYDFLKNIGEFMMNIDTYTAHYVTMHEISLNTSPSDYLRLQMVSGLGMDKVSAKDV